MEYDINLDYDELEKLLEQGRLRKPHGEVDMLIQIDYKEDSDLRRFGKMLIREGKKLLREHKIALRNNDD